MSRSEKLRGISKEVRRKFFALALGLSVALFSAAACKKQASDTDAIRAGILQHLNAVGTLNVSAMDVDLRSVAINGNQAHAEVEFRPKTGDAPGAAMNVSYDLEKRDGAWVVLKTQPRGGTMQHPNPNQNPHTNQNVHSGLPNFNDILNPSGTPSGAPAQGALPPGHPPIGSQPAPPPSPQDQSPTKKPR